MRGILREVLVWRSPARALARAGRFGGAAPPARIAGGSAPRGPGRVLQRCDDAPRVRAGGRHTNVVAAAALALLAGVSLLACARAGAQPPQVAHARQVDVAWAAGGDAPPLMRVQHTLPRSGPGAVPASPPPRIISFGDVSVVDVETGTVRPHMRVDVEDGRITRVDPPDSAVTPRPARPAAWQEPRGSGHGRGGGGRDGVISEIAIDGRGKFLIPGLWDSHVHLTKLGAGALAAFVAYGVTSVRDMGSDLAEVQQWRREIEAGDRPGPRIKTSGQILETPANVARMKREATVEPVDRIRIPVGSPAEADAAVARLAKAGADLIKVRTVVDEATLRAMAAAAHAKGLKLAGHPVAPPDTLIAIRMDSVEHLLTFPPLDTPPAARRALFERMRDAGVAMGTTTVNLEGSVLVPYSTALARLKADPLWRLVSRYLASDWQEQVDERKGPEAEQALATFRQALPDAYRDLREMHAAGVRFLAGSDAAVVFVYPGDSLHGELQSLVDHAGLKPADALRAATMNPAAFFGLERELGAIKTGYRADLVLLDANPLEDIRATRKIAGVVRNGHWLDRPALDALLDRAAADAKR